MTFRAFVVSLLAFAVLGNAFAPGSHRRTAAARAAPRHSLKRSVDELKYNAMLSFVDMLFAGAPASERRVMPNAAPPRTTRRRRAAPARAPAPVVDDLVVELVPDLSYFSNNILEFPAKAL